mgnify:CR=1 FL=1
MKLPPNAVVLWRGPSQIDGGPIVVIATALRTKSSNEKTGAMVQTYILREDVDPVHAITMDLDRSICGDCPHRAQEPLYIDLPAGSPEAKGQPRWKTRSCYVNVGQGALGVWRAYKKGNSTLHSVEEIADFIGQRKLPVRLGTYGDPAAAPLWVWETLVAKAPRHTGYTHQWKTCDPGYRRVVMASADSMEDMAEAMDRGYRTFRVARPGVEPEANEIRCPASEEAGKKTSCASCGLCAGSFEEARKQPRTVMITVHGIGADAFVGA